MMEMMWNRMVTTMTMSHSDSDRPTVNTNNDGAIMSGNNLPNHSTTLAGRGKFVGSAAQRVPQWRTKQELYRFIGWALVMEERHDLPNEEGEHTLEEVIQAIRGV